MTPVERIQSLYAQFPTGTTFESDVADYLQHGYVISTPELFVMAKAIPDAWFIYAFAGRVKTLLDFIPYPLQYICFQRRGKGIKTYDFNKMVRRIRQQG